ncbi:MAG TPA: hypothetical protein PKH10_03665 [bacterium]|nr:hypothetical protein [bacterium]
MERTMLLLGLLLLPFVLAGYEGTPIGGEPYEKWEEGAADYFVMFNSLIDDQITLYGEGENRQADACVLESSFNLNSFHIPNDAIVVQAYLVWMGAVDPAKFAEPTDNAVHLKFARDDLVWEKDIIAGDAAKTLGDTTDPFLFQSVQFTADVTTGCTETEVGTTKTGEVAYFTYRKDVTDFFKKIQDDNLTSDNPLKDGLALFGKYTVSGLDCTEDDQYKCNSTMVSNWSILLVYRSEKVKTKKIYLYPGLAYAQGEATTANVSGFSLPRDPLVRLTAMTAGGDATNSIPELPPEFISLKGEMATSAYVLTNNCNPLVNMIYEVYNSNSSVVGWEGDVMCVSGVVGGSDYFGIDNDTFLLDAEEDINLQEHLRLDGTNFDVRISVNQDAILMNYLVVSVDTKSPAFDIPEEAKINFPYNREKHSCSCRKADDPEDAYCVTESLGYPMFFLIRVQNWGTNVATNVTVIDNLDDRLEYVPLTTEMATRFEDPYYPGDGTDWTMIPDLPINGSDLNTRFPLSGAGYKVADMMAPCDRVTYTCTDTRLLRFKVKPKKLPTNEIIPNIAVIKEEGSDIEYRTNSNNELKLYRGVCLPLETCPEPHRESCGGFYPGPPWQCSENMPCPDGSVCDLTTHTCDPDPDKACTSAKVSYALGINSPDSGDSPIIVPKGTMGLTLGLTLGQFRLQAENCYSTKYYNFVSVRMDIKKDDPQVAVSNLSLVYDKNGNGTVDPDDPVLVTVLTPEPSSVLFAIPEGAARLFTGADIHYFIVTGDLGYNNTEIPAAASMHLSIPDKGSFLFEDAGSPVAVGERVDFAEFQVEPTGNYFIVTKGLNDPPVPAMSELRKDNPILQLRTKAIDAPNKIKRITVNIPVSATEYDTFGHGIRSLSLYGDTNGDGQPDGGPLAKISEFSDEETAVFEGEQMESYLTFNAGEEKFLIINGDLSGLRCEKTRLEIKRGAVTLLDTSDALEGLPVQSKEIPSPEDCGYRPDNDPPSPCCCACSVIW